MNKIICRVFHGKDFIEFTARRFTDVISGRVVKNGTCAKCGLNYMTDGGVLGFRSYKEQPNE